MEKFINVMSFIRFLSKILTITCVLLALVHLSHRICLLFLGLISGNLNFVCHQFISSSHFADNYQFVMNILSYLSLMILMIYIKSYLCLSTSINEIYQYEVSCGQKYFIEFFLDYFFIFNCFNSFFTFFFSTYLSLRYLQIY